MINLEKIAELVKDPSLISNEQLDELLDFSKRHAYSPIFSILYLKGMSKFNQLDFEDVLKEHAYKIPSRERLFCLIHENEKEASEIIKEPVIEVEDKEEIEVKTETLQKEEPKIEEISEEVEETHEPEVAKKQEVDPLEREILAHAINSSISAEIEDSSNYKLTRNTKESNDLSKKDDWNDENKEDYLAEIHSETKAKTTSTSADKKSFSQWMNAYISEDSNSSISSEIKSDLHEDEQLEESEKIKFKENILEEEKKINPKKEFFSPTKKAKESLDESALPVSETLAKIYGLQGNIPKAISAYQQLMLKIPEKKSFFALRIEELKKNLNK